MPLFSFEGKSPAVHPDAFIAPTATLIGEVIVEAGASVWYNAVLRADLASITIRAGANVQDGSVLHTPPGVPCEVGRGATIAHLCMVHGATVGEEALIGNNSTVLDGAVIGARSMIAAQSLVLGGTQIPDEVFVIGSPAKVKGPIAGTNAEFWVKANPGYYQALARRHIGGLGPV
jgi:carbonic anhydrase/acetyltransferase-like protein (isoleucine patch superfamily)